MSTLARTDLSQTEYAEIRKLAIDRKVTVAKLTGDKLRELIPSKRRAK